MRQAYLGVVKIRDAVLNDAAVSEPSPVRVASMKELLQGYKEAETLYLSAFIEADDSFKNAAKKVNKQQIEKEILNMVKEVLQNQEHLKHQLQTVVMVLSKTLSDDERGKLVELLSENESGDSTAPPETVR